MLPMAEILRIKNCHLKEINKITNKYQFEELLKGKGFHVSQDDGFLTTYENCGYKHDNENTIVIFDKQGNVTNRIFGLVE